MNEEKTIIAIKDQTGLGISKSECDITTNKVIVNGIEITSTEDWEKVIKSLVDLQKENQQQKEVIEEIREKVERLDYDKFVYTKRALKDSRKELLQILDKYKN